MKWAIVYWLASTVLVGSVDGYRIGKCPNDHPMPMWQYPLSILAIPGVVGWLISAPLGHQPRCEDGTTPWRMR
jgi:hypothetical protein